MLSGNLHVINVSSSDQGQYKCTAANHITGELIDGQRVLKLVVKGAPVRTKPATITWQPEERYISQIGGLFILKLMIPVIGYDYYFPLKNDHMLRSLPTNDWFVRE